MKSMVPIRWCLAAATWTLLFVFSRKNGIESVAGNLSASPLGAATATCQVLCHRGGSLPSSISPTFGSSVRLQTNREVNLSMLGSGIDMNLNKKFLFIIHSLEQCHLLPCITALLYRYRFRYRYRSRYLYT